MNELPDVEQLVICGMKLAEGLDISAPTADDFRTVIEEVLITRENYESAKAGLITQRETAYLIMAHFQALICKPSNMEEASDPNLYENLLVDFKTALFG